MADDMKKAQNAANLVGNMLITFASGTYKLLGTSTLSLSGPVGNEIINLWENSMGLEIEGETPQEVMSEVYRILQDEYGLAESFEVRQTEEGYYQLLVSNCVGRPLTDMLIQTTGQETPFLCPVMNTGKAVFARMGVKGKVTREPLGDHGSIFTFIPI